MTGAMIPEGADCVVKQEDTDYVRIADPDQDRKTIKIYNNVGPGENYCPKGEDFSAGELLGKSRTFGGFLSAGGSYVCGSTGHYCI